MVKLVCYLITKLNNFSILNNKNVFLVAGPQAEVYLSHSGIARENN